MVAFDHDRSTPRSRSCKFADRPPRANPLFFLQLRKWTPQKTFFPFATSHRQTERDLHIASIFIDHRLNHLLMSIISGFVPRFDSSLTSSKVLVCSRTAVSSEMSQTHAHHTRDGTNRTGKPFSRSTERKTSVDPSYRVQQHGRKKQKEKKPTEATHTWTWTGHHWRRFLWCARAASLCPNPLSIERSGVEKKPVFLRRLLVPQPPPFAPEPSNAAP